ncbi:MAG: hypothetical protein R3C09_21435 [Pirellulaceae bacterium]
MHRQTRRLTTPLLAVWLSLIANGTTSSQTTIEPQSNGAVARELIADNHFEQGCILWEPKTGRHVEYGRIAGVSGTNEPVWGLAQWSSREKLLPDSQSTMASGALRYANAAKSVTFGRPGTAEADLSLAVNAGVEYGDRVRQRGEPWPHLLVEQRFVNPPVLSELTQAHLHIEARLTASRRLDLPGYSPQHHAAQNLLFFTLKNCNRASAGYGQLLWFGVPLYDDRVRIPNAHRAQDVGKDDASGMFIFTVAGKEFTSQSLHDMQWVTIDKELLPFMREGLTTAWQAGFLQDSQDLADYRITSMNLGWEVPGVFDVEMQYRNLSLMVSTTPKTH